MRKPTYKEQHDKVMRAYMTGALIPRRVDACFIGNLFHGASHWSEGRRITMTNRKLFGLIKPKVRMRIDSHNSFSYGIATSVVDFYSGGLYTYEEVLALELRFMTVWHCGGRSEESLFQAMVETLDMLKELHEVKGEVIEATPITRKRHGTFQYEY